MGRAGVLNSTPHGTHGNSGDISDCHSSGRSALGMQRIEARGVTKQPTVYRTSPFSPATKNFPATEINSAQVEKLV